MFVNIAIATGLGTTEPACRSKNGASRVGEREPRSQNWEIGHAGHARIVGAEVARAG